jgi:hypothetical protein
MGCCIRSAQPSQVCCPSVSRFVTCVALSVSLFGPRSALALSAARTSDVAATRAYLVARHGLAQAVKGDGPADEAAVNALLASVNTECPNVLAGAPATAAVAELDEEAVGQVVQALIQPQRHALITFARTVKPLHWGNVTLNTFIHAVVQERGTTAGLMAPNICTDASALAANGFQRVSASTTLFREHRFQHHGFLKLPLGANKTAGGNEEVIQQALLVYERTAERSLITREPAEVQRKDALLFVAHATSDLLKVLGIPLTAAHFIVSETEAPSEVPLRPSPESSLATASAAAGQ